MLAYIKQPVSTCLQVQMKFLHWDDAAAKTGFQMRSFAIKLNMNAFSTCIHQVFSCLLDDFLPALR
jgi:hypothetical protein